MRKETVYIEIQITSRNGDMQPIRIRSGPATRMRKCNQIEKTIYQNRKDLSWLHFDDKLRDLEGQQVKD